MKISGILIYLVSEACCCGLRMPNMIITKAKAKENLGEFICLSIRKTTLKAEMTELHDFRFVSAFLCGWVAWRSRIRSPSGRPILWMSSTIHWSSWWPKTKFLYHLQCWLRYCAFWHCQRHAVYKRFRVLRAQSEDIWGTGPLAFSELCKGALRTSPALEVYNGRISLPLSNENLAVVGRKRAISAGSFRKTLGDRRSDTTYCAFSFVHDSPSPALPTILSQSLAWRMVNSCPQNLVSPPPPHLKKGIHQMMWNTVQIMIWPRNSLKIVSHHMTSLGGGNASTLWTKRFYG